MRRVLLTVAAIGTVALVVVAFRGLDWSKAWDALRHAQLLWLVPAFAVLVAAIAVRAAEPARIIVRSRLSGTSKVEITGTAIVERVFDLLALLFCFFVLEPWL